MLLFTLFALVCASGCARGVRAVPAAAAAAAARDKPFYPEATHAQHFEEFKVTYNKQYATPEEERRRFEIFKSNLNHINELNAKFKETEYGITRFTDLTKEEVVSKYTGLVIDTNRQPGPSPPSNLSSVEAPEAFDWRDKNVVTRVKDQETCGSCWAFATIGSLESHYAMKTGKLVEFSEQQLLDCDPNEMGCLGGDPVHACEYIHSKGEMLEADYPYKDKQDDCAYSPSKVLTKSKVCHDYVGISEDDLKKVLFTKGPMVIGIDGSPLLNYKNGILQNCDFRHLGHAVLLVGYGTENGIPFWTIKNSWGDKWGEQGYFRIQRGNNCLDLMSPKSVILPVEV